MQRVSKIVLRNSNSVLLQLRDTKPEIANSGMWSLFGGVAETGERAQDAALRELQEELGWQPASLRFVDTIEQGSPPTLISVFEADCNLDAQKFLLTEGQAVQWFSLSKLPANTAPWVVAVLEKL